MSYIRSTSNSEKLYIWGDLKTVHVAMGSNTIGTLPITAMDGLIKKYISTYFEDCKYAGAEIKEVCIAGEFKMQLSYKDQWKVEMWRVTWDYIALTNYKKILNKILFYKSRTRKKQVVS